MAEKQSGLGLYSVFADGEREWGPKFNHNHTTMSHITHPSVRFATPVTAEPNNTLRTLGATFLVGPAASIASSSFRQYANSVIVWDDSQWYRYPNMPGLMVHAQDTGWMYVWNGTAWLPAQNFAYSALTGLPEPMWYKAWLNNNNNISNNGLLGSASTSSSSSSSSSKIFANDGRCISPGFYDIRYQVQANKLSPVYSKLNIQIKVDTTIVAESIYALDANLDNSPWTYFTQCITQINQNDFVIFDQVVNNTSLFQAIGGEYRTFATIHRIR